jgi:hypothetical protein
LWNRPSPSRNLVFLSAVLPSPRKRGEESRIAQQSYQASETVYQPGDRPNDQLVLPGLSESAATLPLDPMPVDSRLVDSGLVDSRLGSISSAWALKSSAIVTKTAAIDRSLTAAAIRRQ